MDIWDNGEYKKEGMCDIGGKTGEDVGYRGKNKFESVKKEVTKWEVKKKPIKKWDFGNDHLSCHPSHVLHFCDNMNIVSMLYYSFMMNISPMFRND